MLDANRALTNKRNESFTCFTNIKGCRQIDRIESLQPTQEYFKRLKSPPRLIFDPIATGSLGNETLMDDCRWRVKV